MYIKGLDVWNTHSIFFWHSPRLKNSQFKSFLCWLTPLYVQNSHKNVIGGFVIPFENLSDLLFWLVVHVPPRWRAHVPMQTELTTGQRPSLCMILCVYSLDQDHQERKGRNRKKKNLPVPTTSTSKELKFKKWANAPFAPGRGHNSRQNFGDFWPRVWPKYQWNYRDKFHSLTWKETSKKQKINHEVNL